MEPVVGESASAWVTFIYQDGNKDHLIGVVSNLSGKMGAAEAMDNLPGTDLWYRTYRLPADTRETYQFSVNGENILDPLNPKKEPFPLDEDTGVGGWESSVFELPGAPPQPWTSVRLGVPSGKIAKDYLDSKILENRYPVWIYTPPGYSPDNGPIGYLLMLDGWFYTGLIPATTILDNLLSEGRIPPLAAILIGSLSYAKVRKRDYGCYPPYRDFLTEELLPWARQKVNLTADPNQAVIVGASRGGLMAAYIGLNLPGIFGNVLTQSGSFGWRPKEESEPGWLARQVEACPEQPLRFYLEAGLFETDLMMVDGFSIDLLASNRQLRDVLRTKGYPVHYREFSGGHSTVIWRGTLVDGLLALLGREAGR